MSTTPRSWLFPVADEKHQEFYTEKYGVTHPTKPGLKIPQMFEAAINKELKGLWIIGEDIVQTDPNSCLLYTSPSPRDAHESRMPSSA